jgi:hypothetical protein
MPIQAKDRRRRPEGGEWESIKISRGNLAYVQKQNQRSSLLTRPMPDSYRKASGPRNWAKDSKSMRKHNKMQINLKWQPKSDQLGFHFLTSIL